MNYEKQYDYGNIEGINECSPSVRHRASFEMLECRIEFNKLEFPYINFWVDGTNKSKDEAEEIIDNVSKILSFIFALPFNTKNEYVIPVTYTQSINSLLSKPSIAKIRYVEEKIKILKKTKKFFYEILDLLVIAYDNYFKYRIEDSFIYFFKVIERIAKQNYILNIQNSNKNKSRKSKEKLKHFLKDFSLENLHMQLTEDMLESKTNLLYKNILGEFYGNIFSKISFFFFNTNIESNKKIKNNKNIRKVNVDINKISKIVRLRNKIAHGAVVNEDVISDYLMYCEFLAVQMISMFFFERNYVDLHITSYRYNNKFDPYRQNKLK